MFHVCLICTLQPCERTDLLALLCAVFSYRFPILCDFEALVSGDAGLYLFPIFDIRTIEFHFSLELKSP